MSSKNSEVFSGRSEITIFAGRLSRALNGHFRVVFIPKRTGHYNRVVMGRVNVSRREKDSYKSVFSMTSVSKKKFEQLGNDLGFERVEETMFEGEL